MSKIIAIDYGLKRIGVAISDESRVLAFGLDGFVLSILRFIGSFAFESLGEFVWDCN